VTGVNDFETRPGPCVLRAESGPNAGRYLRRRQRGHQWVASPADAITFTSAAAAMTYWRETPGLIRTAVTPVPAEDAT
jgi:hypothetical protein